MIINSVFNSLSIRTKYFAGFQHFKKFTTDCKKITFSLEQTVNMESVNHYVKIGEMLKKTPSPFIQKLDELLLKREKSEIFSSNRYLSPQLKETLEEIFISIVAPSMAGKTQAAFGIKSTIPLYFVFGEEQNIYAPYFPLSDFLLQLVREDMDIMKEKLVSTNTWPKNDSNLPFYFFNTRENLFRLRHIKSKTLGLFVSLFQEAEKYSLNQDPNKEPWLLQFCETRDIVIDPITIEEFQRLNLIKKFNEKYCIFLDEFCGNPEFVLIRNLCRMLKIACIVSSTNSKVINLIGLSTKTSSRTDGYRAWSVVFEYLSHLNKESLESNSDFELMTNELSEKASNVSKEEFDRTILFLNYLQKQYLSSRPGFALNMLESLKHDIDLESFSLDRVFDNYIKQLHDSLKNKKQDAFVTFNAAKSYCKLISGNFFNEMYIVEDQSKNEDISYLVDDHFFYLKHPRKTKGNPFLLLKGLSRFSDVPALSVDKLFDFEIECYFDKDEELLLLACLYGKKKYSAYTVISSRKQETPMPYLSNLMAVKRSGSKQENLGFISIISSTQESLRGIYFDKFLKNLLWNLSPSRAGDAEFYLKMDPKISQFFDKVIVPFLLPVNMEVPKSLNDIFPEKQSNIKLGSYHRDADKKSVDSVFDIFKEGGGGSVIKAIFEAKNRSKELNEAEYLEIIQKAVKYSKLPENLGVSFPVHLTFCSELKKFKGTNDAVVDLQKISLDNKINILRMRPLKKPFKVPKVRIPKEITRMTERLQFKKNFIDDAFISAIESNIGKNPEFELVPWSAKNIPLHEEPKMTAIIFEIDDIITEFQIKKD